MFVIWMANSPFIFSKAITFQNPSRRKETGGYTGFHLQLFDHVDANGHSLLKY